MQLRKGGLLVPPFQLPTIEHLPKIIGQKMLTLDEIQIFM
jgi:hypothetical protein